MVAAVGALVAGGVAAVIKDPYPGPASTAAMLHGFDIVNAGAALSVIVLVVPVRRGSHPAVLAQMSLLAYLVYTYAFYLFGVGFSDLFLLHVLVVAAGVAGLAAVAPRILALSADPARLTGARPRVAAVLLALLAVGLGGMWVFYAVHNAITGDVPPGSRLVETSAVVQLGMALDLALLVPWYATAAVLLWRRRPTGCPAAVVALAAGLVHQLSYIVAMPVQVIAGVAGAVVADPAEPVVVLVYGVALALVIGDGRSRSGRTQTPAVRAYVTASGCVQPPTAAVPPRPVRPPRSGG